MHVRGLDWIAPLVAAAGLAGALAVFAAERSSFKDAVVGWARHDLAERTELASARLREPLETGDFAAIHQFGAVCAADGVRLTVTSAAGGLVFDSVRKGAAIPEAIYETRPCGEWRVSLGLPLERVLAPFTRAGTGFLLAALIGGAGVLLVLLSTYRQGVRYRELARVEKFRREFIADVSHEIKTPLTGIMGAADLLGDEGLDEGASKKLIGMVKGEASRLNDLAQNILDLARLEREGEAVNLVPTDIPALVGSVVERFAAKAESAGVKLDVETPDGGLTADVDPALVSHALSNLVENAIRHSKSPSVKVSASHPSRRAGVELSVEDRGVGIPADMRGKVFDRFFRVDPARAASTGGAGLGLAIVRRIARLHGGDVALSPVSPSGSRFTISLPGRRK